MIWNLGWRKKLFVLFIYYGERTLCVLCVRLNFFLFVKKRVEETILSTNHFAFVPVHFECFILVILHDQISVVVLRNAKLISQFFLLSRTDTHTLSHLHLISAPLFQLIIFYPYCVCSFIESWTPLYTARLLFGKQILWQNGISVIYLAVKYRFYISANLFRYSSEFDDSLCVDVFPSYEF